jgi:2-polyprenyl-3-methyl-5-hydroxy-6-metoxy-1,4-benzoquinol methylase
MVVGIAGALDEVVAAYRSGAGVPYARYDRSFRHGQGGINRPAFRTDLTGSWIPAVSDVHERLSEGGARVADVGCGLGWSTIALAQAYPDAEVIGYDLDASSITDARANADSAGVSVRFERADATAVARDGLFDVVLLLETLHDLARPVEVLAACREALRPDGAALVADENVAAHFVAPGSDLERMMYGWSISHCLPASMAEQPSAAIGTVIREDTVRALADEAGFTSTEIVDVDAGFFRLYRLTP